MENATKALIMAAGVLLGILILSLGVYLFSIFGQYSANAYETMEKNQLAQFNSQFLKYYGKTSRAYKDEDGREKTVEEPIKCTAHDIISIANLAQQNNKYYQLNYLKNYDENTNYIQVDIEKEKNIEQWDESRKIQFITENSTSNRDTEDGEKVEIKYFYIKDNPTISKITKRVCYIKFVGLKVQEIP